MQIRSTTLKTCFLIDLPVEIKMKQRMKWMWKKLSIVVTEENYGRKIQKKNSQFFMKLGPLRVPSQKQKSGNYISIWTVYIVQVQQRFRRIHCALLCRKTNKWLKSSLNPLKEVVDFLEVPTFRSEDPTLLHIMF